MFVSKRRIILKTCGTTTPLLCLKSLLYLVQRYAGYDEVQVWPHCPRYLGLVVKSFYFVFRICSTRAKITSALNCSKNRTAHSRTRPPYWTPCFTVGGPITHYRNMICFDKKGAGLEFRIVRIEAFFRVACSTKSIDHTRQSQLRRLRVCACRSINTATHHSVHTSANWVVSTWS